MSACVALRGASLVVDAERDHAAETLSSLSTARHDSSLMASMESPAESAFASMFVAGHHFASSGTATFDSPSALDSLSTSEGGTKKRL